MHITHTKTRLIHIRVMTRNLMRITILLVISLLYIETDSKSTSTSSSSSWFQEKYLDEKYNHYYKYAFETDYEDRITCPEIHKPAMMNAVTGASQYTMTRPRRRIIPPPPIAVSATTPETDPPLFQRFKTRFYILDITIRDIVIFIIDILVIIAHWIYCIWQVVSMTVMLTMPIIVTWLVLVMFFGQY
jgi:hypothetical protein